MSHVYEDEQNDLGQANFEKSYGAKLSKWYEKNLDRAESEGYTPENLAEDMYRAGRGVQEGEDFQTWATRNGVNRFVESINFRLTQLRQQREDDQVRQQNLATKGDLSRGLSAGIDETQGIIGGGGMMLLGKLAGGDNMVGKWLTTKGSEYYQQQMREASLNPTKQLISDKQGQFISDDIQGAGDVLDWAQGEFGKLLPSMALGLLSGGLGAGLAAGTQAGGRAIAAPIMKGFVERQANTLLAKGFVKEVAGKTAQEAAMDLAKRHIGGRAGAWLGTALLETSGSFADTVSHLQQKYTQQGMRPEDALLRAHDEASGLLATGTGLAAGGIEMLGGNIKILDKVLGKKASTAANELIKLAQDSRATSTIIGKSLNALKALFVEAVKAAPSEFGQESAQEILNILNVDFADPDFALFSADTIKQAIAAGAAGAVGGGIAATASAVYDRTMKGSAQNQITAEASALQQRIANQEAYLKANPNKAAENQARLDENKAELEKLLAYQSDADKGVSYADAISRIQNEAPHPSGKKFNARALKTMLKDEQNPLTLVKDAQGQPVRGSVDKASLDAFIAARKGEVTPVAATTQPAGQAAAAQQTPAASSVVDEDEDEIAAPGEAPAPPASVYDDEISSSVVEEDSEVFSPDGEQPVSAKYREIDDSTYKQIKDHVVGTGEVSLSKISRRTGIDMIKVAHALSRLQDEGIVRAEGRKLVVNNVQSSNVVEEDSEVFDPEDSIIDRASKPPVQPKSAVAPGAERDVLHDQAVAFIQEKGGKVSRSALQKQLRIGSNRAARLLEQVEADKNSKDDEPSYMRSASDADVQGGLGRKVVEATVAKSKLSGMSHVFEDLSELDDDVREAVVRTKGEKEAAFFYKDKVYFNSKAVRSEKHLVHTIAHEIIHPAEKAHVQAMARRLGVEGARQAWGKTVDHVYASFTKDIQKLYSERYEKTIDMKTVEGRRKMTSEFLAEKYATDGGKDPKVKKWYERVATAMRQMFNGVRKALGLKPLKMNDEEVMQVIRDMNSSFDSQVKGEQAVSTDGEPQYSRAGARSFADLPEKEPGQKSMIYAGVGSRQTPPEIQAKMKEAAAMLKEAGYSLRTGDAAGADAAFASVDPDAEVFKAEHATDETRAIAKEVHPAASKLKSGEKALNLHARNTFQVFGKDLDSPVDFVLTWTPDGAQSASETGHGRSYLPNTGGTGQAIRLASMKGIPVINMARAGWQKRLQAVLDGKDVLATPAERGTPRTSASTKPAERVAGKKAEVLPPVELPAPSMDAEFGGTRTQFAQPMPTVTPPIKEQKGHVSLKIIFPEGWSVSPSPSVNPNAKVRTVPYEGKVEYGRKERPADQSSPAAPAPAVQEKLLSEKLESFAQRGFEFEVDANGNPTDRLVSKLTEEQVRQLSEVADPEQNPFAIVDEGGFQADSRPPKAINYDSRRRAVNKLIASGGLFTRPDLVSVEISNNPDFEHAVYGLFDRKMDFGFFESAKAYWEHWRGMIHKDINEKDPVMRRMSPAMKVIYERMLVMERGLTIMSGKLAPEQRDAFDANVSRIESEGVEAVDARVDKKTAMQIVAGLRQAVSERGEIGMQDFLLSNPYHEKRHRFAAFIKSEAIMRPGLTGQPGTLIFRFRKPGPDGKIGFFAEDYGKSPATFVSDLTGFYNEILTHAASVGALNEDQAEFLKLSHHRLDLLRESTLADVDPTEVGEPFNFTRDALIVALNETGMAGALKAGIPLPVTTVIGEKTEISEVLDRFHELKSQDENLDALTDSEFLVGIIGMGQDRAGKEADARLANVYDPAKAPVGLLAKLARAGFIKMKGDGYYAVGKFEGVLRQIRLQSFMKDMDQVYSPRQGFFSGPQYSPRIISIPLGLDEVATLRPGSILIHPRRETFGVIGPVMENGRFTILVPYSSLKPGGPYYLGPAKGKDGKVATFSKTRLGELGYHHVPAIWDLVQTKATDSGIQAQNIFSWVNAEAVIESRQALRHAAADTGLNLDGVGHGRLVSDPLGRSYLALASAGGPQFLLEVTDGESAPAARLEDAMARLHTQIRDAIGSIVGPETDELTASQMKRVRAKVRSLISDLVDRKQITEAEANELRSEMASLYKAVLNSLDDINEANGPLMARLYQQLGKSGFLGTEQVQEYLVMQELMGATQELEEGGRSVDEDGQSQGSGFSHADALEMMSAESFSETLRDLFGLNKTESFAEAYQNLKDSAKLLMAEYRRAKREGAYPGLVGSLYRLTKAKLLALRAIKKNDLHLIARSTLDEKLGMEALKEASEVLGLRSIENRPDSQVVVERMFDEISNMPLPTSWLTDKSSPLYLAVPEAIRRKINAYVNFKTGKIEGIGSMLRGREQFTIASLSNTTHPRAKALGLYLYAALSSMPSIDGDKVTLLAANAAYFKAVSDLSLKMRDGSEKKLSELPAAERDMVKKVMMSGGLYAQLVSALQVTRRTFDENGNIIWPQDLTEWPKAGTADAKALYEMAMKFKIDSRQSTFGLMAALDLPRSAIVDIEDLALRLGNQEIPADAALMLEGVAPEDRHFVYDYKAYRPEKPELFMQFSDNVHLRPDVFHELLEDAIRSDEPIVVDSSDAADVTMFEMDGVTYKLIPEDKLAEEADANAGIEIPYDNGVVTGADYEILQHMKQIFKGAFKLSGGAISRDGRSSTFVFNGQIYPADFRERFVSPFGNKLLEHFRALHDQAWTDDEFAIENPFQRQAIREQMFAWEQFALQHPKQAATVKERGGFRTAKRKPKHALNVTPEAEPRFLADIRAKVIKMVSALASIPQAERPNVVIHGVNETGESFLKTAEGRRLIPADIQAELLAEGGGKDAMKKLRLAMGLVTTDGAIHIFPGMHADAAGNIDNVELARTVFHEAVGHVALRHILGPEYESFMLSVFRNHVDPKGELSFTRDMKIQHAEEFIAAMADKISYNTSAQRLTNVHIGTILDRVGAMIMQAFRRFMSRLGFKVEISKVEIRELLARAFKGSDVKAAGLGFMGPAMMPAENLPNYEGMGQYEPNLADRFLRNVSDKLRYWELLFRSREASGERIRDEQNFMYALRTLNSRVGYMTDVSAKLEDRFIQSFRGKNFSQQDVGEVLLALHTLERAEQDAKDYLANIPAHMVRTGRDIPSPEEAARGITSEDKIAQEVAKAKKRIASGTLPASTGRAPQWATKRLETASRLGHYDSATGKGSMAESIAAVLEASAMTVGVAEQSGMISREFADDFRSKFKHFVAIPGANKFGFGEVGGVGLQGRSRFAAEFDMGLSQQSEETPDVIAYTFANLRHRIVEAEVNRSNQAIADFALANPNAGVFTVYLHPDEVRVQTDLDGNPYYELPPGFRTMTGPGVIEGIPGTQDKLREYEQREGLIPVYRNGVLRHFRIEHEGLRKSYERTMNPAKQGWLMKQLGKVNRYLIGVNTMLNPEFLIPNLFRDAGAAMNTLAIQGTVAGISGKTGTDFVKEFAPRIRHAMRALYAQNFGKNIGQLSGEAAKIAGYIEEFERSGGKIQWPYMESAVETMKNMEDSIATIQGRANLRQKAIAFGGTAKDFMKRAADIFENATRLSAFVTARENGVSVERAAMLSREITVDFDRKGDVGQAFNTLYLFANAGLQGTLVIARAIRNNPQRAAKHLSAFVGLSFSLALANILMGGDDDDGEPSYFAIPEETRNGNLIIMLPFSDGTPLRIPLPYGYAFFWAVGQEMVNAVFGRTGAGKATLGILSSALNNFNPLESAAGLRDAHGFARLGAPTLIDPFVDIFFEQTAFGTPLMPEKTFEQQPDSTRHWRSVSATSKEAARLLNEAFGGSGGKSSGLTDISPETLDLAYETITGGLGKFLGRTLGLIMAPVSGRELGANDLPIARRFIGGKLNWEDRGRFKSNYAEIQGANRTMKNLRDNVNMAKIPELKQQAIRDRDDFMRENGHLLAMRAEANRVVSRIGDLDKQKERLYKSGLPDSQIRPQLKVLDEKQKTIFAAFNEKYYKAVDLN